MSELLTFDDVTTRVHVRVLRGRDLVAKDLNRLRYASDPYVEVWAYSVLVGTTAVAKKTLHPFWLNAPEYTLHMEGDYVHFITLKIWDEDPGGEPDPMGEIKIKIKPRNSPRICEWYEIPTDLNTGAKGSILLELQTHVLLPKTWSDAVKQQHPSYQDLYKNKTKIQANLTLVGGSDLPAKDRNFLGQLQKADPFIEIFNEGKMLGMTNYKETTLNPLWEESFSLEFVGKNTHRVLLKVWDFDDNSAPDFMGSATFKVPPQSYKQPLLLKIDSNSTKDAKGELRALLETKVIKPTAKKTEDKKKKKKKYASDSSTKKSASFEDTKTKKKKDNRDSSTKSISSFGNPKTKKSKKGSVKSSTKEDNNKPAEPIKPDKPSSGGYAKNWREGLLAGDSFDDFDAFFDADESNREKFKLCRYDSGKIKVQDDTTNTTTIESARAKKDRDTSMKSCSSASIELELEDAAVKDAAKHEPTITRYADTGKDTLDTYFLSRELVEETTNKLQITILGAKDLIAKKKEYDPYVEFWVYGHCVGSTGVVTKTRNPEWHNETFNCRLTGNHTHTVSVHIYGGKGISLGKAHIKILPTDIETINWYKVVDGGEGAIRVKLSSLCLHPESKKAKKNGSGAKDNSKDHKYKGVGKNDSTLPYFLFPGPCKKTTTKIQLEILKGEDLAAKDRNALIQLTTSDPFVEIWAYDHIYGYTATIMKSLNPEWRNEVFNLRLTGDYAHDIFLKIWDEDINHNAELMGVVNLKVRPETIDTGPVWYEIPKDSARNAKGRLQVKLKTLCLQPGQVSHKKKGKKGANEETNGEDTSPLFAEDGDEYEKAFSDDESDQGQRKVEEEMPKLTFHRMDSYEAAGIDALSRQRISRLESEIEHLKEDLFNSRSFVGNNAGNEKDKKMLELLRGENKRLNDKKAEFSKFASESVAFEASTKTSVELTIIQGSNLVAMDVQEGRESSDPYVEIWKKGFLIGKTSTRLHTLHPKWNECFQFIIDRDVASLDLKIWDEDFESPDSMGEINLKIQDGAFDDEKGWHKIPRHSNPTSDAKGVLQVRLEIEPIENPRAHIDELEKAVLRLRDEVDEAACARFLLTNNKKAIEFLKEANKKLLAETKTFEAKMRFSDLSESENGSISNPMASPRSSRISLSRSSRISLSRQSKLSLYMASSDENSQRTSLRKIVEGKKGPMSFLQNVFGAEGDDCDDTECLNDALELWKATGESDCLDDILPVD